MRTSVGASSICRLNGVTCRYVQYYTDVVHHGPTATKQLRLRRVTVSGLTHDSLEGLVVTVKLRPPGAGWDTDLVCLAAMQPQQVFLEGATVPGAPCQACASAKKMALHVYIELALNSDFVSCPTELHHVVL